MKYFTIKSQVNLFAILLLLSIILGACSASSSSPVDNPTDISQLAGKKVGVITGTIVDINLSQYIPGAVPVYFNNVADETAALKAHKISSFIVPEPVARELINMNDGFTIIKQKLSTDHYAYAFNKNNLGLQIKINQALKDLNADGTVARVEAKWIGADEKVKDFPQIALTGINGTLVYGTDSENSSPFDYTQNNQVVGYEVELMMHICEKLGYGLKIVNMDFSAIIPALESGRIDIAGSMMVVTDERKKTILFSDPNYSGGNVAVIATSASLPIANAIQSVADLKGKRVGVLTGTMLDQILEKNVPTATAVYFNTYPDQIVALQQGKIDAIILDTPIAIMFTANNKGVKILPEKVRNDSYALAVNKNNPILTDKINKALKEIKQEGTLESLSAKWLEGQMDKKKLPEITLTGINGTLRLGTNSATEPFAFVDGTGKVVGYDVELATRIAQKLGMNLEVVDMEFSALIPALQAEKVDVIGSCITVTPERAKMVNFSDSYYAGGISTIVRDEITTGGTNYNLFTELVNSFKNTFIVEDRYKLVVQGLGITFLISILSGIFGSLLGFIVCMARLAKSKWANIPARIFVMVIQGTPIVVFLMILYYVVFRTTNINAIIVAVIAFAINFGAYTSEMMRTGIESVDQGQLEAASAIGFNKIQVFLKITFPQAARRVLPVFKGEFISMVKMTSVVGYIAIQDLTKMSDIIRSRTYEAFFPLIATALIYFLIANSLTSLMTLFELTLDPKHRKRIVKGVVPE